MKKLIILSLTLSILLVLWTGCIKNNLGELTEFESSMTIINDTTIELSWTNLEGVSDNVTEYLVVRSPTPINDFSKPGYIIERVTDLSQTTFTDILSRLSKDYYYAVFVDIGNRYINGGQHEHQLSYTVPFETSIEWENPAAQDKLKINWTTTSPSFFKGYTVVHANTPISDDLTSIPNSIQYVQSTINSSVSSVFYDVQPSFINVYYQVNVDLGDRIIRSGLKTFLPDDREKSLLNIVPMFYAHNPDSDHLYVKGSRNLIVYNYGNRIGENTFLDLGPGNISARTDTGSSPEILILDDFTLDILDANSGNGKARLFTFGAGFALTGFEEEFVLVSHDNVNNASLGVYGRQFSSFLTSFSQHSSQVERNIAVLNEEDRSVVEISRTEAHVYRFSNSTSSLFLDNHKKDFHPSSPSDIIAKQITVSPDKQYFVGGSNGIVFHRTFENNLTIDNSKTFTAFAFSEDGQKLYAASTENILYTYSFPNLTELNADQRAFNIKYIIEKNGKPVTIGPNFIGNITVIEYD